ncbi:MAG: DNA methyltransferase [Candidatus Thermoplasmatota archaeon]|nr:DNA methyltransferase [Candidatus Thermoplasmatota archaeon]
MKEITHKDYKKFIKNQNKIVIEDRIGKKPVVIGIGEEKKIKKFQPKDFELEGTNVWSYPKRGDWATHRGDYRGNWPPQMVRNILLRYSEKGDTVLDQMVGSGTTLIECKLLGRNGIGVDINKNCIMLTRDRLDFRYTTLDYDSTETTQKTYVGDARNLDLIEDESIDLIATHPPYANIIPYSKEKVPGDLSNEYSIDAFIEDMVKVAAECYRVLKPNKYCAILIGDTRREKHHVPISFRVMQAFLELGFILKEDVIKHQWRCKSTPFWLRRSIDYNFLLLMHEHLFVFRKPQSEEELEQYPDSTKWW